MALPIQVPGDMNVQGTLSVGLALNLPDGAIGDAEIAASAGIQASKLQCHFRFKDELFAAATTVAAIASKYVFTAPAAGTLRSAQAVVSGAIATGSDRTITLDLQKSTGGGGFATVLSVTFGFTHSSTLLVPVAGTIASPNYVAGDSFQWVVSVAGSAGAQATGLGVTLAVQEAFV